MSARLLVHTISLRVSGLAAILVAFFTVACFKTHDTFTVEMQASEDLQCPRGSLVAEDLGGDYFIVKGCEQEAHYSCVKDAMGNFDCQRKGAQEK